MGNFVQPEELNLATIFKGNNYIIPIYQRSYAWGKDEIEQLITDIADSNGRYYIGSLIVDKVDTNLYSVIDGQQRLTTIFLLLSHLKPSLLSQFSLKFEAREKSNRTLSEIVLKEKQTLQKDGTLYSDEILDGLRVIENFFKPKDEAFKLKFCNRFQEILIIKTQVPKGIDLNHYFEIMNTRGEQLEIHEIAKGRLLGIIDDADDRNIAATIWDACSKMDSYIQMNFNAESRDSLFCECWNKFTLEDFSDIREKIDIKTFPFEARFSLLEKLKNSDGKNTSAGNATDSTTDSEENQRFETIVTFPNFLLLVNEALLNNQNEDDSSLDDKKFIDSLKRHWKSSENAKLFIFNLLKMRFFFDKYIIKREFAKDYKDEGRWSLQKMEMYYDERKTQKKPQYYLTYGEEDNEQGRTKKLRLLQSALRVTYTAPKTMHWISAVLCKLMNSENADLIELLEKYACRKILTADYKNAMGFGIDRIVFTYLDYILERDGKSKIPNFNFQFRTSIEHFYPQTPIDSEPWADEYLHSFGNLALITVKANSKFSNLAPQSKVDSYPETIKQSPKLNLMQLMMHDNGGWTEDLVRRHEEDMKLVLDNELRRYNLMDCLENEN